jgi:CheY-like chemotaxis protein
LVPAEPLAPEPRREGTKQTLASRRRVLVIDDSLDYLRSMVLLLRSMGHYANFAINATAAIPVARRFRPDVVLLDVGLPDGDGRQLAALLRCEAGLGDVQIICVTGRAHEDPRRSLEAGCDAHYVKPLDTPTLRRVLAHR